jgi:hypothetical protein
MNYIATAIALAAIVLSSAYSAPVMVPITRIDIGNTVNATTNVKTGTGSLWVMFTALLILHVRA